ncbi:hypothetical protein O988_06946 [Pseudogymnoascus sp. VKM F-3808]|nr:hypothetical protein O988_06946 [Pseudogymnoascus sp. VKM F-3808]
MLSLCRVEESSEKFAVNAGISCSNICSGPTVRWAHWSTKASPFFANHGSQPEAYKTQRKDDIRAEQAMLEAEKIRSLQEQLATDIQFMNERSAAYANRKRSMEPGFKEGDEVYILRKHIKTKRPSTKLDFKILGPFRILNKRGGTPRLGQHRTTNPRMK